MAAARAPLTAVHSALERLETWNVEAISAAFHGVLEQLGLGMGKVAPALRVALVGNTVSPDISHTIYLTGRERALARIEAAVGMIPA